MKPSKEFLALRRLIHRTYWPFEPSFTEALSTLIRYHESVRQSTGIDLPELFWSLNESVDTRQKYAGLSELADVATNTQDEENYRNFSAIVKTHSSSLKVTDPQQHLYNITSEVIGSKVPMRESLNPFLMPWKKPVYPFQLSKVLEQVKKS